ncbi:hypothetical protein ES708_20234 [subsurface metagenome]
MGSSFRLPVSRGLVRIAGQNENMISYGGLSMVTTSGGSAGGFLH